MGKLEFFKKLAVILSQMVVGFFLLYLVLPFVSSFFEGRFSKPIAEKIYFFISVSLFGGLAGYFMGKANELNRDWKGQSELSAKVPKDDIVDSKPFSKEEQAEVNIQKYFILSLVVMLVLLSIITADVYTETASDFYYQLYSLFFVPSLLFVAVYSKIKLKHFWETSEKGSAWFMVAVFSFLLSFCLSKGFELVNSKFGEQVMLQQDYRVVFSGAENRDRTKVLLDIGDEDVRFLLPKLLCDEFIDNQRFSKEIYVGSLGYHYIKDVR